MRELFRDGVRWVVHEASTALTPGAQTYRCLIFDSEGSCDACGRFPSIGTDLADAEILRLLDAPPTPAHGIRAVRHSGSHPTVIAVDRGARSCAGTRRGADGCSRHQSRAGRRTPHPTRELPPGSRGVARRR